MTERLLNFLAAIPKDKTGAANMSKNATLMSKKGSGNVNEATNGTQGTRLGNVSSASKAQSFDRMQPTGVKVYGNLKDHGGEDVIIYGVG